MSPENEVVAELRQSVDELRVGVLALAVGILRIIVTPVEFTRHRLVQKGFGIVHQRVLPFIYENRRGGVERLQVHNAFAHAALANDLVDAVSDVDQLHAIVCDPVDNPVENPVRTLH